MYTKDSTFGELLENEKMATLAKYFLVQPREDGSMMGPSAEQMRGITFTQMCGMVSPAWNPDSMADGFNAVQAHLDAGVEMEQIFYSDEELKDVPSRERTGLVWFPAGKKGPFALVCSGGAYATVANMTEAFPVAHRLNELGISAFVLQYRAGVKGAVRKSYEDLVAALRFLLANKDRFGLTEDYAAFGFSAGGHLVSLLGTDHIGYHAAGLPKPRMLALGYPLITLTDENGVLDPALQEGAPDMFEGPADEEVDEASTSRHVSNRYPRTYIWQTKEDEQLSYEKNGVLFYEKLKSLGVECRFRTVEHGMHGLGLGKGSEAEGWLDEAVAYWKE